MEEYLSILLEQLRSKKARKLVEQEIRGHIEDQAEMYIKEGTKEEEAIRLAVRDMGDPVKTGISLDHIHRPAIAWSVIGIAAIISLISIMIHIVIGSGNEELGNGYIQKSIIYILLGFAVMLIVYRLDYSFMARYAKAVAFFFLLFQFAAIYFFAIEYNGARAFLAIRGISISLIYIMFLFVPIYGALLYQYHGTGYAGLVKSLIWMILPVIMSFKIPCTSLAILMFFMMAVVLTAAICKNWFCINKKLVLALFWGCSTGIPILFCLFALKFKWLSEYQSIRLQLMLGLTKPPEGYNYIGTLLREFSSSSHILGASGKEMIGALPDYYTSYILTFLGTYFGIAAAIAVCCLLAFLTVKSFHISFSQKNQLGMIMGFGCGMVFSTNIVVNILESIGIGGMLVTQTFLPFVSYGGTGVLVSYILLGIVLSIYRYKSILPIHPKRSKFIKNELDVFGIVCYNEQRMRNKEGIKR